MNSYQKKYWNMLVQFQVHVFYLRNYAVKTELLDTRLNIFLALASSASIAGWVMWKDHQMIWGGIIAASQVITAIKPFLPYKKRLKPIGDFNNLMREILLDCERDWFSVSEGLFTEKEIHERCIALQAKTIEADRNTMKNILLPIDKKALKLAEIETGNYLANNY